MSDTTNDIKARLREHDDPRLYHEADVLMSVAADYIVSQEARIAELELALAEASKDALEDAANKFDGTTAYNWTAADGYSNAFDIASELRYMAMEAERKSK
jgi:hypothetical protein